MDDNEETFIVEFFHQEQKRNFHLAKEEFTMLIQNMNNHEETDTVKPDHDGP